MNDKKNDSEKKGEVDDLLDLINNGREEKIDKMLKNDSSYEIWNIRDKENDNSTLLHISVYKNNFTITLTLIKYIENNKKEKLKKFINTQNDLGITALHFASFKGNVNIIKLLIKYGADYTILTKRKLNVVHYATQGNKPNSLVYFYFLFKNKDEKGKTKLLQLLKKPDISGCTPLHWASYSSAEDVLLYLLNLKIYLDEKDQLEFINKTDNKGNTALHLCVKSKSTRIATKLLQNGANPNIKDNTGKTPYQLANESNLTEIASILKTNKIPQMCKLKAPIKKEKPTFLYIFFTIFLQLISECIMTFSTMPIGFKNDSVIYIILFYFYECLVFLFFVLYFLLVILNPGVKPAKSLSYLIGLIEKNKDLIKYCYKCYVKKDKNSKHCIICDKCYKEFDHHCFWINKCVAKNNFIVFCAFLCETFILLFISLIINILCLYRLISNGLSINKDEIFNLYFIKNLEDTLFNNKYAWIHFIINLITTIVTLIFTVLVGYLLYLRMKVCFKLIKNKRARADSLLEDVDDLLIGSLSDDKD